MKKIVVLLVLIFVSVASGFAQGKDSVVVTACWEHFHERDVKRLHLYRGFFQIEDGDTIECMVDSGGCFKTKFQKGEIHDKRIFAWSNGDESRRTSSRILTLCDQFRKSYDGIFRYGFRVFYQIDTSASEFHGELMTSLIYNAYWYPEVCFQMNSANCNDEMDKMADTLCSCIVDAMITNPDLSFELKGSSLDMELNAEELAHKRAEMIHARAIQRGADKERLSINSAVEPLAERESSSNFPGTCPNTSPGRVILLIDWSRH